MKNKFNHRPLFAALACSTALLTGMPAGPFISSATAAPAAADQSARATPVPLKVSWEIGEGVFSADHARVGDMADCVLQFDKPPQLRYVIVREGGFFQWRDRDRAVPADAVEFVNHRLQLKITQAAFKALPILPDDARAFFGASTNLTNLAKLCDTPVERAALDPNYVTYTDLVDNATVLGDKGQELGIVRDLWVDFNVNEAPYLQFEPTNFNLDRSGELSYDIPTIDFKDRAAKRIRFSMNEEEIGGGKFVDDMSGYVADAGIKLTALETKSIN
jgi:hypothetical protein